MKIFKDPYWYSCFVCEFFVLIELLIVYQVLLLKSFLHHKGLSNVYSGGLGSFSLTLLVAFYLEVILRVVSYEPVLYCFALFCFPFVTDCSISIMTENPSA